MVPALGLTPQSVRSLSARSQGSQTLGMPDARTVEALAVLLVVLAVVQLVVRLT
jgi:hypothetical protein